MSLEIRTHKNILIHLLKDIYTDKEIGPFLGFRGELLDAKQKAWVKQKLRTDTIFLLKIKISS